MCRKSINHALLLRLAEVLSLECPAMGIQKCMEAFLVDQGPLAFSPQWGRDAHPVFWKTVMHNEELSWPKGPVAPLSRNIGFPRGSELQRAGLCVRGCLENLAMKSQSLQWRAGSFRGQDSCWGPQNSHIRCDEGWVLALTFCSHLNMQWLKLSTKPTWASTSTTQENAVQLCGIEDSPEACTGNRRWVQRLEGMVGLVLKFLCYLLCAAKKGRGLPRWLSGKESTCQCKRRRFNSWVGKISCERTWQPL